MRVSLPAEHDQPAGHRLEPVWGCCVAHAGDSRRGAPRETLFRRYVPTAAARAIVSEDCRPVIPLS